MTAPAKSAGGQWPCRRPAASAAEDGFVRRPENQVATNLDSTSTKEIVSKHNAIAIGTRIETPFAEQGASLFGGEDLSARSNETMSNYEAFEYNPQMETYETGQAEWSGETEWGGEVFSEAETMELASELLEVGNEAELDRFLGDLISKAGKAIGSFVRSPVGKAIGGWLKGAAKQVLPIAGGALGGFVGGPLGAKIGSGLASYAGSALGLEAEMSQEDREFEGAKNFVKIAADAVKSAAAAAPGLNPVEVAKAAVKAAVQKHAPGLLNGAVRGPAGKGGRTGRWVRHGRNVIIVNCG
jgi:hypothetical protein